MKSILPIGARVTALCSLIYAVCWILPNHHIPWPDFYSDAWAGLVLGLMAAGVLAWSRGTGKIPLHASVLVVLILGVGVWIQYTSGLVKTIGVAWISFLYLLGFALAMIIGAVVERLQPGRCADFLFSAVLIGALASLPIQFQQWLQVDPGALFWLFLPAPPDRFHANLGQANQLASLLCLGVLACAWFYTRQRLSGWVAWILSVMLATGLALTESRTSWLVIFYSIALLFVLRKPLAVKWRFLIGASSWVCTFVLFVFSLPFINLWIGRTTQLGQVRAVYVTELRFEIWAKVWDALLHRPWFGYGWMQSGFTQFVLDPTEMVTAGTHRYSHNIFLDIGAFAGLPIAVLIAVAVLVWTFCAFGRIKNVTQLMAMLFWSCLMIHSMLEYPLYYGYFLLPFGLMVGVLNESLGFKPVAMVRRIFVVLGLMAAVGGVFITAYDYVRVEDDFFSLRFEYQNLAKQPAHLAPDVVVLNQLSDAVWLARVDSDSVDDVKNIERALNTVKLFPSAVSIYKLASIYAMVGEKQKAEYWLNVLVRLNKPGEIAVLELRRKWDAQAEIHPAMSEIVWPS